MGYIAYRESTHLPAPITPTLTTFMDKPPRKSCVRVEKPTDGAGVKDERDLCITAGQRPAAATLDVFTSLLKEAARSASVLENDDDAKASQAYGCITALSAKVARQFAALTMISDADYALANTEGHVKAA